MDIQTNDLNALTALISDINTTSSPLVLKVPTKPNECGVIFYTIYLNMIQLESGGLSSVETEGERRMLSKVYEISWRAVERIYGENVDVIDGALFKDDLIKYFSDQNLHVTFGDM